MEDQNPAAEQSTPVNESDINNNLDQPELTYQQQAELDTTSEPFEGEWNRVVSSSNWHKGQIIFNWRLALQDKDLPATEFSDEAWSQRVGCITGQHVGRLRRVFERFGDVHEKFEKLYWSHFQAALEWNDAEMWLEGAVQNKWSVSSMRNNRWETMGKLESEKPNDADIISAELDEDFEPGNDSSPENEILESSVGNIDPPSGLPVPEGPDFGDEDQGSLARETASSDGDFLLDADSPELVKPFAEIGQLPEDVMEAFDAFKLAIIHHKATNWEEIKLAEMLGCLESLKVLAQAPSGPGSTD